MFKRAITLAAAACLAFSSVRAQRAEPRLCDTNTDQYVPLAQMTASTQVVQICGEYGESGDLTRVFALRRANRQEAVLVDTKAVATVTPFAAWVGRDQVEGDQQYRLHRLWFREGVRFHVFEQCSGGYRVCEPAVRYVVVEAGRKVADQRCVPDADDPKNECRGLLVDGEVSPGLFTLTERPGGVNVLKSLMPKLVAVAPLPPVIAAIVDKLP